MSSLTIYVQFTCLFVQKVALQMLPMNYQQIYYQDPMQYYTNNMRAEPPLVPEPKRRSGKTRHKKARKHQRPKSLQTCSSEDNFYEQSESSSSSESESRECRCSCDQCTQPEQCCIDLCSTCPSPSPSPGIVFIPYPYPMVFTQPNKKKNKESNSDKAEPTPGAESIVKEQTTIRVTTKESTTKPPTISPSTTTKTTPPIIRTITTQPKTMDTTATITQQATTTVPTTTELTTTEPTTTGVTILMTTTDAVQPLATKEASTTEKTTDMDSVTDSQAHLRSKKNTDQIEALYKQIGKENHNQNSNFNNIIFKAPKNIGNSDTKYVISSLKKVKDDWLPKYSIVPIPEDMAVALMNSLKGMTALQTRDTKSMNPATPHKFRRHAKHRGRAPAPYTKHLYERHRRTLAY